MVRTTLASALVLASTTATAAIQLAQPAATTLTGSSMVVEFYQDSAPCYSGSVYVQSLSSVHADVQWFGPSPSPSPMTVSGLPEDGTGVDVFISCTSDTSSTDSSSFSFTASQAPTEFAGVVSLAEGATVTFAEDSALTIDSGLDSEQFSRVATALLLTLITAFGVRAISKVLT